MIFQHDNARSQIAKVVKKTLGALNWDVLPNPPYSQDIDPSDYHLFRSMAHGLAEQQLFLVDLPLKGIKNRIEGCIS